MGTDLGHSLSENHINWSCFTTTTKKKKGSEKNIWILDSASKDN
jgi:hypothetical protein